MQHLIPHWEQPNPRERYLPLQTQRPLGRNDGNVRIRALDRVERCPHLLQLSGIVRGVDQLQHQAAHDALASGHGKSAVLGQQACGLQRRRRLPTQARSLEAQAHCHGAPRCAMRQLFKPTQTASGITVVQGPAGRTQLNPLTRFLSITLAGLAQRLEKVGFAVLAVLQGMRAFCRQQVRHAAQTVAVNRLLAAPVQHALLQQHHFGRLTRPYEAPRHQMRERIQHRHKHRPLAMLDAPAPRLPGHAKQQAQRTQRQVQNQKRT